MKVVWFSEIKWNYLKTRKQQIISRKPADVELLFLEPYVRSGRNNYRLRTEDNISCATIPFLKSAPFFPWRTVLDRPSARWAIDQIARRRIQQIFRQLDCDPSGTGFIISNIYAANIVSRFPRKFLLYDCNDDHSAFPGMRSWTKGYFFKTSRDADAVFASADALLEKVAGVRGGANGCDYLGNGVDFEHFQKNDEAVPMAPANGKPKIGYLGALAPWLDFDALADLARRRPEWEIVLVGPILLGVDDKVISLTSLPNVFHLPAVEYDRVPGILRQFHVGLIPFKYTELTQGVNPNKMYEYLACGLPVVSTRFSTEVTKYPDVVKAVEPGEEFEGACEQFLARQSDAHQAATLAAAARQIARDNDWNVIASAFWRRVTDLMSA